jgi:iron(III) transport system substrate-binding protein
MLDHEPRRRTIPWILAIVLAACTSAAAPGGTGSPGASDPASSPTQAVGDAALTVYSGRSESLVGPLLSDFTEDTGIQLEVRYGDTAELASLLLEEGSRSPADVFLAQDAGALGAVAEGGLFITLPEGVTSLIDAPYRDADDQWVGTSGRARVAAYSPERVSADDLPSSISAFSDPAWHGRLGWAPTNGSFQAFVTALRVLEGEDGARTWLEGVIANEPKVYDGNTPAVEAVAAGEIDVAFVNHYYLLNLMAEQGEDYPVANHFFAQGDAGSLVNVAGVGILGTSDQQAAANRFVEYLLSEPAQSFFSEETFEYPLAADVEPDPRLPSLGDIGVPTLDLNQLADLQGTVDLLRSVGAID